MGPRLRRDDGDDEAAPRVNCAIRAAAISHRFPDLNVKQPRQIVPAPPREVSFWFSPL
jgi:hypothetical protein